jgi:hypothetical protein
VPGAGDAPGGWQPVPQRGEEHVCDYCGSVGRVGSGRVQLGCAAWLGWHGRVGIGEGGGRGGATRMGMVEVRQAGLVGGVQRLEKGRGGSGEGVWEGGGGGLSKLGRGRRGATWTGMVRRGGWWVQVRSWGVGGRAGGGAAARSP